VAVVDVVIPSRSGINEEAKGPLTAMLQHSNCFCRDKNGTPLHAPWACNKGKHHVRMMPPVYGSSVVHWARNQAVAQAMYGQPEGDGRPPTEYFLLMDDDMLVQKEYLNRLLSYKADIVCGICTIRRDPPIPNIRYWNAEEKRFYEPRYWDWNSQKLMEIDGAGAAFMLVKRCVFEALERAYLNCHFEMEELALMGAVTEASTKYWTQKSELRKTFVGNAIKNRIWQQTDSWPFQFYANTFDTQLGELGEDLTFCYKAKKMGFKIYADPQVLPGHLGLYGYSIADFRQQIENAIATGQLKLENMPKNEVALAVSA
jgi:hypothetical protein